MTNQTAADFLRDLSTTPELWEKVRDLPQVPETVDKLVAIGAAHGYAFTAPELLAARDAIRAPQISDEALDAVVGGAGGAVDVIRLTDHLVTGYVSPRKGDR